MQDGRYAFRGKKHLLLPLLFLLPQLAITVVFFFYPAGEALMGSFYMEDSFGLSKEFVGLDNFITLFSDPSYLETLRLTLVFSLATIVLTMGTALLFAVLADQVNWGGTLYKSMLIIPYAVAPPLAGVLWLFLFNPSGGVLTELLHHFGYTPLQQNMFPYETATGRWKSRQLSAFRVFCLQISHSGRGLFRFHFRTS